MLLALLALGCLMHPAAARSLSAQKGCQNYLASGSKLGSYSGADGIYQKGIKTRGGYFKTVRKIKSVQACFEACVDTSTCWSFTYDENRSSCSLSSKKGTTSSSASSSLVQFCSSNGKKTSAGFVASRQSSTSNGGITAAEVSQHSSQSSAWVIVDGNVYDVTKLLKSHPGGSSVILNVAGKDASSAFKSGGHSASNKRSLESYKIGPLGTASSPSATGGSSPSGTTKTYSVSDVQTHNSRNSAWVVVNDMVYDLTDFVNRHPGGSSAILKVAGKDGSSAFNKRGRHSPSDRRTLQAYMIGSLDTASGSFPANDPSFLGDDDDDDGDDEDEWENTDDDEGDEDENTDDEGEETDDDDDD